MKKTAEKKLKTLGWKKIAKTVGSLGYWSSPKGGQFELVKKNGNWIVEPILATKANSWTRRLAYAQANANQQLLKKGN